MAFSFEKLDVYQKALNWISESDGIAKSVKGRVSDSLIDQLTRASLSVALNIAEGNGRWHKAEKRQFFWIARGSAFECVPILQVLKAKRLLSESTYSKCHAALVEISKMLTGLIKSVDCLNREFSQSSKTAVLIA